VVRLKDRMEEQRRAVRAENDCGTTAKSGSPGCVLSKVVLSRSLATPSNATPPKRILPKSASDDLDTLQRTVAMVESVGTDVRPATIQPLSSAANARFMLMSPNTSRVESSVIVLPSPIVSSRPVGHVVASPTVLHKSQPSNQTILLVPAADQNMRLSQLKPLPGSTTIRSLSFAEHSASGNVVLSGANCPLVPCFQHAVGAAVKTGCTVDVSGIRMSVAGALEQVNVVSSGVMPVTNYASTAVIAASQGGIRPTSSLAGSVVTAKSSSRTTSRSQPSHKSSAAVTTSSSSSKTVMSLLRESNGRDVGWKAYMRDSRPVASLLREEREKQQLLQQSMLPTQIAQFAIQTAYQPTTLSHLPPAKEQSMLLNSLNVDDDSLAFKASAVTRRMSSERPCSVSDLLNLGAVYTSAGDVSSSAVSSLLMGSTRKRPHTALDGPQASDEPFQAQGFDRTLNVDMIEKSALDDFLHDSGLLSTLPKTEPLKVDDVGGEYDLYVAEPPPVKVSLVNRSAENMTLQQLQQATLSRKSLREHCRQSNADPNCPALFAGRPVSTLGEPLSSLDGISVRGSRPNTVAAFWEPTTACHESSSSVGSCDSQQLTDFSTGNTCSRFTPIQNLSEDVPATSGLVRPTAKVPANVTNTASTDSGTELPAAAASTELAKRDRGKWKRFRHKSLNRSIPQMCSGEQLTVLSDCGAANFANDRSDSPLSAEISDIIASDQRLHLGLADFMGQEDTPSPYRSRSVPASVMLDFSLSDALAAEFAGDGSLDMLTGGTEPPCNNSQLSSLRMLPVSNELNFWDRPARGDHLISGVSFRPPPRNNGTVVAMASEPKETDTVDVVAHTPPSSVNDFECVFVPPQPEAMTVAIDTPTSLESASVSDRFVEELFKEVCDNTTQLLDWDCSS